MVATEADHAVSGVSLGRGELSFEARIGGQTERIWFRTASPVEPNADAALPTVLLPAMRYGGTLSVSEPLSPRILRNQREFQAVQRAWSLGWELGEPPLKEVEVLAPTRSAERPDPTGRVAAFFSGGVDSWAILLENPDVTDLIFMRGFDLLLDRENHAELAGAVEERLREAADEMGLAAHVVETNLRQLSDRHAHWGVYFGCALDAVALFLGPLFDRVLLASGGDHAGTGTFPVASAWLIDHLWNTEGLEVVQAGGSLSRVERTERIADHPVVQRTLRVCWENPGGAYNCGRCRKCLMTMITLEALGKREAIATFPPELDLEAIAAIEIEQVMLLSLWEDVLDLVREMGRADLEPAVEGAVAKGKRTLGLPQSHRHRQGEGPPPLGPEGKAVAIATPSGEAAGPATAEMLDAVLASRSWRMTAPLRRAGARLRRLRARLAGRRRGAGSARGSAGRR